MHRRAEVGSKCQFTPIVSKLVYLSSSISRSRHKGLQDPMLERYERRHERILSSQQCASTPSDGFIQCCCHLGARHVNGQHQTGSHSLVLRCQSCASLDSRSCCFLCSPLVLYRLKQALDATHRHYYSCVCCMIWQHDGHLFLCATLFVVNSYKYNSLQFRICSCHSPISPASTKRRG